MQLQLPGSPVQGFMADFGEGAHQMRLPPSILLHSSRSPWFCPGFPIFSTSATHLRIHNNFSCAWLSTVAAAFSIAAQQSGLPDDFVAFARSGCISAAKHSRLFWAGDQLTSWDPRDGIGSALTAVRFPPLSLLVITCAAARVLSHCSHFCHSC